MFSKIEMASDAFSAKTSKEAVQEKREPPSRTDLKNISMIILITFLIVAFIWQTIYLMQVSRRLRIVEDGAEPITQTMSPDEMTFDEFNTHENTTRNRRSTTDERDRRYVRPMYARNRNSSRNVPNMPSAHLVANRMSTVPADTYINWNSYSPSLSHNDFLNVSDTFIKVTSSGYYYVYTQLTLFLNKSSSYGETYGFQVTVHNSHNDDDEDEHRDGEHIPILTATSVLFPIRTINGNMDSIETKHIGGTFLLCRGDEVGVRSDPMFGRGLKVTAGTSNTQSTSFFGLMQINKLDPRVQGRYCTH